MSLSKSNRKSHLSKAYINRLLSVKNVTKCKGNLNDLNVVTLKDEPKRETKLYRVKRVVSPYEFYMERAAEPDFHGHGEKYRYEEWFPKMQAFYRNPSNTRGLQLPEGLPLKGHIYVCQTISEEGNVCYQRVRVYEPKYQRQVAEVYFCDLGKIETVEFSSLRKILPEFCGWSSQVFRCYLYDLLPYDYDTPTGLKWSPEACSFLKEYLMGRPRKDFHVVIMARSDSIIRKGMPEFCMNAGVVLFEKAATPKCSVNAMMVKKGFATPQGVMSACSHQLYLDPGYEPVFNVNDFENCYGDRLAQIPEKSQDSEVPKRVQIDYTELVRKHMPGAPPPLTWITDEEKFDIAFSAEREVTDYMLPDECFPEKFRNMLAYIKDIPHYLGSFAMIVHLAYQYQDFKMMESSLAKMMPGEKPLPQPKKNDRSVCGRFISCFVEKEDYMPFWGRAVVQGVLQSGELRVLMVDYGWELDVPIEKCKPLPSYFLNVPSFAVRIHLDCDDLIPSPSEEVGPEDPIRRWSEATNSRFFDLMNERKKIVDRMYMYRQKKAKVIELDYYDQEIVYDLEEKCWVADDDTATTDKGKLAIGAISHISPLLRSLHLSFGVDIYTEYKIDGSAFWHFHPLWEEMLEEEHLVRGMDSFPITPTQFHKRLVSMYDKF